MTPSPFPLVNICLQGQYITILTSKYSVFFYLLSVLASSVCNIKPVG